MFFEQFPHGKPPIAMLVSVILLFSAACAGPNPEVSTTEDQPAEISESSGDSEATSISIEESSSSSSTQENSSTSEISKDTEERILEAIATDIGQPVSALTVEEVSLNTWPDGCLGLPNPDELCTMALVDGWHIQVMVGEDSIGYRTDLEGTIIRREN